MTCPSLSNYIFYERLGSGTYGSVYKGRASDNPKFVAIKCIRRKDQTKTAIELFINEITLLKEIKHEHIVEMFDFQCDKNYIYIVMEYCSGGDLATFLRTKRQLSERSTRTFLRQLAKALRFLYEKNIAHMDLKPANILLKSKEEEILKLADFGVAQKIGVEGSAQIRGTFMYMAPEILISRRYDKRVDLWSIGVILYECLFGRVPFVFDSFEQLLSLIQSDNPIVIPDDVQISPACRHLLENLLMKNPDQRLSFEAFFEHPFIADTWNLRMIVADSMFESSIVAEHEGNLELAFSEKIQAIDELVEIMKNDDDRDRRKAVKDRILRETKRAEDLKEKSSLQQTKSEENTELFQAFQHCKAGNKLADENQFRSALDKFDIGLASMLEIYRKEKNVEQRKSLHDTISFYLTRAEECKKRQETQSTIVRQPSNDDSNPQKTCLVQ